MMITQANIKCLQLALHMTLNASNVNQKVN
jgi:hypothetical protein